MVDWFYIGYCTVMAMLAIAFAYAAVFGFRALRGLPRSFRLAFAAVAIVTTLAAQWTIDNAFANVRYPPWSDGVMRWKIPVAWYQRFADEQYSWPRNSLETLRRRIAASESYLQIFTMTENGTVTISKFDHGISRTTNDVIRLDGVIVNH